MSKENLKNFLRLKPSKTDQNLENFWKKILHTSSTISVQSHYHPSSLKWIIVRDFLLPYRVTPYYLLWIVGHSDVFSLKYKSYWARSLLKVLPCYPNSLAYSVRSYLLPPTPPLTLLSPKTRLTKVHWQTPWAGLSFLESFILAKALGLKWLSHVFFSLNLANSYTVHLNLEVIHLSWASKTKFRALTFAQVSTLG